MRYWGFVVDFGSFMAITNTLSLLLYTKSRPDKLDVVRPNELAQTTHNWVELIIQKSLGLFDPT